MVDAGCSTPSIADALREAKLFREPFVIKNIGGAGGRPPGMPAEAVQFWEQSVARMVKTEAWKKAMERHLWFDAYADSASFRRDRGEESKVYAEVLTQLGMAKGLEQK